jgi:hypothetical protein
VSPSLRVRELRQGPAAEPPLVAVATEITDAIHDELPELEIDEEIRPSTLRDVGVTDAQVETLLIHGPLRWLTA